MHLGSRNQLVQSPLPPFVVCFCNICQPPKTQTRIKWFSPFPSGSLPEIQSLSKASDFNVLTAEKPPSCSLSVTILLLNKYFSTSTKQCSPIKLGVISTYSPPNFWSLIVHLWDNIFASYFTGLWSDIRAIYSQCFELLKLKITEIFFHV